MKASKQSHLTRDMAWILFFSAGIPAVIGLFILFYQMRTSNELQKIESKRIYEQIETQASFAIKSLHSNLAVMGQSSEVIDYMLTPINLRSFVENRLVGKINSSSTSLSFDFYILDNTGEVQFSYPASSITQMVPDSDLKIDDTSISVFSPIQFDDQNFQNASALKRGYLVGVVKKADLFSIFPQIRDISGTSFEDLSLTLREAPALHMENLFYYAGCLIFIMFLSISIGLGMAKRRIVRPIRSLSKEISDRTSKISAATKIEMLNQSHNELKVLRFSFETYIQELQMSHEREMEAEKAKAFAKIATQVAHDVRSPLSALNLVAETLVDVSEDRRVLLREATQRINDIANNLLNRFRQSERKVTTELLPAIVDSIVSEKRIECRPKGDVRINLQLEQSYGLYSQVDAGQLKRVLSNLLNNAIEALGRNGEVIVRFESCSNFVHILIQDNGWGIPAEVLRQIGQPGKSFGKNGNGLGLAHAKEMVSQWGGSLGIQSRVGEGTTVRISLKRVNPPNWFVENIQSAKCTIVVDDDQSIHEIWKQRLGNQGLVHLFNGPMLQAWLAENPIHQEMFFLFDHEFVDQSESGLDLIRRHDLQKQSILVTSRYEDPDIRATAEAIGVKILPKGLSPWVPVLS